MFNTKLHIGNLPFEATASDLCNLFAAAGNVRDALVITDKRSGRSLGFGFISMANDAAAKRACADLDQIDFRGRRISVKPARKSGRGFAQPMSVAELAAA